MLKTALFPKVTASQAHALTEHADARDILEDLTRRNYFTVRHVAPEDIYYEYHPLFRELVLERGRKQFSSEQLAELKQQAACLLAATGNAEAAVQLWIDIGAWEQLSQHLCQLAPTLLEQGRWKTLVEWVECLPTQVREADSGVAYWLGMALVPFDPRRARAELGFAHREFKATGMEEFRWHAWCGMVDSVVFEWRDFHPLDELIDEAEHTLSLDNYELPPALNAPVAAGMFMALMHRRPWHANMVLWAQRTWDLAIGGTDPRLRLKVGPHLVLYYTWWTGELKKAALLLSVLRPHSENAKALPLVEHLPIPVSLVRSPA